MKEILANLNQPQREAVTHTEGPLLILAGAGSGKTRVLTHRVAYLIQKKGVDPNNILAITFTNKAAQEMKSRISALCPPSSVLRWMGTFHSMCVKILRIEADPSRQAFSIYDEADSISVIKEAMKNLNLDPKQYNPQAIRFYISGAKNELIDPSGYERFAEGHFGETVLKVYREYERILKKSNAFDFDDLLMKTVELFKKNSEILAKYQRIFRYILVDEYQDTNHAQYVFIKMLAEKYKNICVVGDDSQAIYSFRGANFRNILNFERDWPEAKVIKLEQNYRSTQRILEAANEVIKKNITHVQKNLWTENENGTPIAIYEAGSERNEAEFILTEISSLARAGSFSLNDFAILYRTNAQSRALEEAFLQFNIPYRLVGAVRFYERKEIKDILAYLRLLSNPNDFVSLKRIINVPPRGIGEKKLAGIKNISFGELESENPKVQKFFIMAEEMRRAISKMRPDEIIDYVGRKSGYFDFLDDGSEEGETRLENIAELKTVAAGMQDLGVFLEQVALIQDTDNYDPESGAVTLMTLHAAKGLEFKVVFLTGMEEGIFPHSRSLNEPAELEEERRLCYVGITRAKKRLYLIYANSRMLYGGIQANLPSRFLSDIPEELMERI